MAETSLREQVGRLVMGVYGFLEFARILDEAFGAVRAAQAAQAVEPPSRLGVLDLLAELRSRQEDAIADAIEDRALELAGLYVAAQEQVSAELQNHLAAGGKTN